MAALHQTWTGEVRPDLLALELELKMPGWYERRAISLRLEENGEPEAARKLREQFPID